MSSRDRPRDDDLEDRLDELEDVLSELRADLRASERDRRLPGSPKSRREADSGRRGGSGRETGRPRSPDLPRPPRLSELVRFTEQHTIPTVIALLETTIRSLKLVQGTLRLLDPERDAREDAEATAGRLADVRDGAADGLARSLSELRTALAAADLPEEAASRSILEDARDLTAEIESRIEDGRRRADDARKPNDARGRRRTRDDRGDYGGDPEDGTRRSETDRDGLSRSDHRRDGAVHIDVSDPDEDPEPRADRRTDPDDEGAETTDPSDERPEVDVESELDSIKRQLDAVENEGGTGTDGDESTDGADEQADEEDGTNRNDTTGDEADDGDTADPTDTRSGDDGPRR